MTIFNKAIRQASLLLPFLGLGLLAHGQSNTVDVTNNTSCELYVEVYGSPIAGSCSGPGGANADGVVPAGSTVTVAYPGSTAYFNVGATAVYSGSVPHPNAPNTSWAGAVHPLQTCPGAVNRPGSGPCGGFFLSITAAGNVEVN